MEMRNADPMKIKYFSCRRSLAFAFLTKLKNNKNLKTKFYRGKKVAETLILKTLHCKVFHPTHISRKQVGIRKFDMNVVYTANLIDNSMQYQIEF